MNLMISARDCKDVSDLSPKLDHIFIDEQYLTFGPRTLTYTKDMDILDQCIALNLFLQLNVWPSQFNK
jgi:hypothetical protein